jgi:hypothetical protein
VAVKNAIKMAKDFVKNNVQEKIQAEISLLSEEVERVQV